MTAKEFIENQGLTTKEPYSYFNQQWLDWMKEYARIKCIESIRNTKYAAIDIVCQAEVIDDVYAIQNIPNQDVMPDL